MAAPMTCDGPDNDPALFLIQNIVEAEVNTFCLSCMLDFSQALLQTFAPDRLAPPPKPAGRGKRTPARSAASRTSGGGEANGNQDGQEARQATS